MAKELAELTSEIKAYDEAVHKAWPISPIKFDLVSSRPYRILSCRWSSIM